MLLMYLTFIRDSIVFLVVNKTFGINNLKARTAMNANISVFAICVKAIISLLLYNLHDCNVNESG